MTSPAKLRANRRNGAKGTGPKTAAGKARAARNARRHGFNLPVLADPGFSSEIDDLARTIEMSATGGAADARGHDHACEIAGAIIDLRRVRAASCRSSPRCTPTRPRPPARCASFMRLDRYERRALWRKLAIRAFIAAVAPPAPPPASKTNPTEKRQ